MRSRWVSLAVLSALSVGTILWTANPSWAQRRGGRGGRGAEWGVGYGSQGFYGYYDSGYRSYYGPGYYRPGYYDPDYYDGYYGSDRRGRRWRYYDYSPGYYDYYYSAPPDYSYGGPPDTRSYYESDVPSNAAVISVELPANADLFFDGTKTKQNGSFRQFVTPPLEKGTFSYEVRARWNENGRDVERTKNVNVHAGDRVTVDLMGGGGRSGEELRKTPRERGSKPPATPAPEKFQQPIP